MEKCKAEFFLGSISANGFAGYYKQAVKNADCGTPILIKGGPGCGKSTILKRLAAHLEEKCAYVEYIHCAGDASSLDGVITSGGMFCAVDATEPHVIEPQYPQTVENIISLYDALDSDKLYENRAEIIKLFERERGWEERAKRYVTAAANIMQDTSRVAMCFTDLSKAKEFGETLAKKYITAVTGEARESIRLLSAVTPQGLVFYSKTIDALAENVIVLDDEFGLAGKTILSVIRQEALSKGHKIITCYCPLSPFDKIEHIFIPALSLAFVTANAFLKIENKDARIIHCTRFCNKEGITSRRKRIRFNKKASEELMQQGSEMLIEAQRAHSQLEAYYTAAMTFEKADEAYARLEALTER